MIKHARPLALTLIAMCGTPVTVNAAQSLAPEIALFQTPASKVPVALQNARWHMNDATQNMLSFTQAKRLFTTRTVSHSGLPSQLITSEQPLLFSYEFEGKKYRANEFQQRTYSNAMLIMKKGRIVHEEYLNNTSPDTHFIGWSTTKSIVGLLVGIAISEGRIKSVDDSITDYLPELQSGAYAGVTIRQILQMRSGVEYEERYDFNNPGIAAANHIQALVQNTVRFADAAINIKRAHGPGEVFEYKTIDTAVLGWLIERITDGGNLASYMTSRLWEPLGAESDGFFIMDGEPGVGREFSGAGFNVVMRDYARIGEMMLNSGYFNGKQIVPKTWVQQSVEANGEETDILDYGMQWWTISGTSAYCAIGLQGQFIYVDPATETVIVKFSFFPRATMENAKFESIEFFKAASIWSPFEN